MSQNPYAPPVADLGSESLGPGVTGRGDFDLGRSLSEGWRHTWPNFWLWLLTIVVWTVTALASVLTGIGILLLLPVLGWGFSYFTLRMHDGGAKLRDVFAGFSRYGKALASMLGVGLILGLVGMVGQSVDLAGSLLGEEWLRWIGALVSLGFALFVSARLNFAYWLVVDRDLPAMEAVRRAWEGTARARWKIVALMLLSFLFLALGGLLLLVGAIPASLFVTLAWVSAYRQMFGGPAAA